MARPVTLFTGQWADLPIETMCQKANEFGYDGLELCCWGDHMEIDKADQAYCDERKALLKKYDLDLYAISTHLVGQCVCTGSPIWHMLYSFPAVSPEMIEKGYEDFAKRWIPILDEYQKIGVKFALEAHPTEVAFDIHTAHLTLKALNNHPAFGFNYDPSHLGYQHVDYVRFIYEFADRIFHVHMKDVYWSDVPTGVGVFGGHMEFGDNRRYWNFRSLGRGKIDFENIIRALNDIGYNGPLSVEWEDSGMNREAGAEEACDFVRYSDFTPSDVAFDDAMQKE